MSPYFIDPQTAEYKLTVQVEDVNDVAPSCTQSLYSGSVAEDAAASTSILTLACTDSDSTAPNNAIADYTIVSQDPTTPGKTFLLSTYSNWFDINT